MGKALYRTYRSKSFDELVGQEHITSTLKNAIEKGAISHAYLFTGPRGVGKTSVARILAHAINDLPYEENATHLDIIEIDAASNRRIDEIRELREKAHISPSSAKYKVYIIDEVHMLTREAFNALLKTLEEPPAHVVFILATTEAHKLPETIISRTQHFAFRPITSDHAFGHLKSIAQKEKIPIDDNALLRIAEQGNGSFRDSISMLDQLKNLGKNITLEDVELLLGLPPKQLVENLLIAVEQNDKTNILTLITDLKVRGVDTSTISKALSDELHKKLIDNSSALPTIKILEILEKLLALTSSNASIAHLEVALLSSLTYAETTQNTVERRSSNQKVEQVKEQITTPQMPVEKPIEPEVKQTPETQPTEPIEQPAEAQVQAKPEVSTAPTTGDTWLDILRDIKGHHNTLYGILRMAKADLNDSELTLVFKFAFHKKQVDQSKNIDIIRSFAKNHIATTLTITTAVDAKATPNNPAIIEEKPIATPEKVILKDVSNIFEGAELLEL